MKIVHGCFSGPLRAKAAFIYAPVSARQTHLVLSASLLRRSALKIFWGIPCASSLGDRRGRIAIHRAWHTPRPRGWDIPPLHPSKPASRPPRCPTIHPPLSRPVNPRHGFALALLILFSPSMTILEEVTTAVCVTPMVHAAVRNGLFPLRSPWDVWSRACFVLVDCKGTRCTKLTWTIPANSARARTSNSAPKSTRVLGERSLHIETHYFVPLSAGNQDVCPLIGHLWCQH